MIDRSFERTHLAGNDVRTAATNVVRSLINDHTTALLHVLPKHVVAATLNDRGERSHVLSAWTAVSLPNGTDGYSVARA